MTLHPTYVEIEHNYRHNFLKEEAKRHRKAQAIQKTTITLRISLTHQLGELLIALGYKLAGNQATT
ncbi:MAG: hypothetical protein AAF629_31265 [Chloroflexota bacterium]